MSLPNVSHHDIYTCIRKHLKSAVTRLLSEESQNFAKLDRDSFNQQNQEYSNRTGLLYFQTNSILQCSKSREKKLRVRNLVLKS